MYCPNCNQEYDGRFCPECGTKLIEKPVSSDGPSINLGDANAINGNINVTDSRYIHHEDKSVHNVTNTSTTVNNITNTTVNDHSSHVTNITNVAAKKTKMELLQERRTKYLNACKRAYEDNVLEQEELLMLDSLRLELELDKATADSLLEQVHSLVIRNAQKTELTVIAKSCLKQLTDYLRKNETAAIIRQIDEIEALADKFTNDELQRKFYLVLAALKPEKCIEKYESTKIDNYWLDFWACLAYQKEGKANKAAQLLLQLEDKYPSYPADNVTLLSVACAYIVKDKKGAMTHLANLEENYTPALQRFAESLYLLLDSATAQTMGATVQGCAFYLINFFGKDFAAEEEAKRKAEEEAKRKAEEEAQRQAKVASLKKKGKIAVCALLILAVLGVVASIVYSNMVDSWANQGDDYYYGQNGVEKNYTEALKLYTKAAKSDNVKAQAGLGNCYYYGNGVEKDYTEAIEWYRKAAEQGYAKAQHGLGNCYRRGYGVEQSYTEAIEWYRKAAEQGYAKAQLQLGDRYYYGQGVEKDYDEAVKWYRKAAEQGNEYAKQCLGDCYNEGKGVMKDSIEAMRLYGEAMEQFREKAESGDPDAQGEMGRIYLVGLYGTEVDYAKAFMWLRKAAEQEDAYPMRLLGWAYYNGKGVEQSYTEAAKWYRKAAEQGEATAQYSLGIFYYYGEGVEQSYTEAVKWYRKAAEQGEASAQEWLADMYYDGKGVDQSYDEAMNWYIKSAEQGNQGAQFRLGYMFDELLGSRPQKLAADHVGSGDNKTEALKWYRKAAEQGNTTAMNNIGALYKNSKDYSKAAEWYRKAAELGNDYAQCNLGNLHYEGLGVVKSQEEAIKWWRKSAAQGHVRAINKLKELGLGLE